MEKWVSCSELMKRWQCGEHDIHEQILKGNISAYHGPSRQRCRASSISASMAMVDRSMENMRLHPEYARWSMVFGERSFCATMGIEYLHHISECAFKLPEIEDYERENPDLFPPEETTKKLTAAQEDREQCMKIAQKIWEKHPILDIHHVINHPDIIAIGKLYTGKNTVRNWIKGAAPERARKKGVRPKDIRDKQTAICEKLGINP